LTDLLRRLRGVSELNKVATLSAVSPVTSEISFCNNDVDAREGSADRCMSPGVGVVQVSLQVGGPCTRCPLVAIAYVTWGRIIEELLVVVRVVVPGKAEGSSSGVRHFMINLKGGRRPYIVKGQATALKCLVSPALLSEESFLRKEHGGMRGKGGDTGKFYQLTLTQRVGVIIAPTLSVSV